MAYKPQKFLFPEADFGDLLGMLLSYSILYLAKLQQKSLMLLNASLAKYKL